MHVHHSALECPVIQPACVGSREVHATVAHGRAEIVVPIGSMQTVAFVKIHGVRHIGQMISRPRHGGGFKLDPYLELARDGGCTRCASGNDERVDNHVAFIGVHTLFRKVHIDPARTVTLGRL